MSTLPPGMSPTAGLFAPDPRVSAQPVIEVHTPSEDALRYERRVQQDRLICELARKRFHAVETFEGAWREKAQQAQRFRAGEQWDAKQVQARTMDPYNPRPCLTLNQTGRFVRQITNAEQQNRPGGKIRPVGSGSDVETASALEGLIRSILTASDWDTVADTAFEDCVEIGKGYMRVLTDYESPWSFEQVLRVERILNPFAVYLDPAGRKHPDYQT